MHMFIVMEREEEDATNKSISSIYEMVKKRKTEVINHKSTSTKVKFSANAVGRPHPLLAEKSIQGTALQNLSNIFVILSFPDVFHQNDRVGRK